MFKKSSPEKQILYTALIAYFGIALILLMFGIFLDLYGLLIGWAIGMAINLLNYLLLIAQSKRLESAATGNGVGAPKVAILYYLRFVFYAGGLILVGVLKNNGISYFDFYTVFATAIAYLVIAGVIFLTNKTPLHKGKAQ